MKNDTKVSNLSLIVPGKVKVDLANFDIKLQGKLIMYFIF